jgi:hypothetical protein
MVGNFHRTPYPGVERTSFAAYLVGTACNPDDRKARSYRAASDPQLPPPTR